jgi:hypothetical protein
MLSKSPVTKEKECWLKFGEGELLRDAQLGVRRIRTRSAGSDYGEGELLREAQLGVRRRRKKKDKERLLGVRVVNVITTPS